MAPEADLATLTENLNRTTSRPRSRILSETRLAFLIGNQKPPITTILARNLTIQNPDTTTQTTDRTSPSPTTTVVIPDLMRPCITRTIHNLSSISPLGIKPKRDFQYTNDCPRLAPFAHHTVTNVENGLHMSGVVNLLLWKRGILTGV